LTLAMVFAAAVIAVGQTPNAQTDPISQIQTLPIDEVVSTDVGQHIERGNRLMRGGRFDDAITEYKSALDKSKKPLFTVYLNLGATYLQKQDYTAAADAYSKAATIRPNDTRAHYFIVE